MKKEAIEILGPPAGWVDILDHATEEQAEAAVKEGVPRTRFPLRPSSSGKCTRELAYEVAEYYGKAEYEKETRNAEVTRLLDLGWHIENHINRQVRNNAKDYFEVKYDGQVLHFYDLDCQTVEGIQERIEGKLDVVLWSPKYKTIADWKSKKDRYSAYFKSKWDEDSDKLARMDSVTTIGDSGKAFWVEDLEAFLAELRDPFFEANFLQLNGYAINPFIKDLGINNAAILQYNKNDSRLREVRFKPSQKVFDKVKAKFQMALDAGAQGKPEEAPRDYPIGSIKCAFCPFKKQCRPGNDTLQDYFDTFPKKKWPVNLERDGHDDLIEHIRKWEKSKEIEDLGLQLQERICKKMEEEKMKKVRMPDGTIYEMVFYKTKRPQLQLKRSKA